MKKTIKTIAMAVLCVLCSRLTEAQNTPRKAGDRMPDLAINNLLDLQARQKISDFKGKLTLLYFWSTNCRASTDLLSEVAQLEKSYAGKLKVISIGKGDIPAIKKIVEERGLSSRTFIPEDSVLTSLFPHYMYPEIVWVGPDQKILGITASQDLNKSTIDKVLNGQPYVFISPKSDRMDYDADKPLFTISNTANTGSLYYSILSPYAEGLPGGMSIRKDSSSVRINAINQGRLNLFFMALKLPQYSWPLNRIAYENVTVERFVIGTNSAERRTKEYCYELSLPEFFSDEIHAFMLKDLENLFRASARIEKRSTSCYVLSAIPGKLNLATVGAAKPANNFKKATAEHKFMLNSTLYVLAQYIESLPGGLPVIDETGFSGKTDLAFSEQIRDVSSLNNALFPYGLKIERAERPMDILVFKSTDARSVKPTQLTNKN
ncbi:DUF3738 domain-containing protein [Daejeonella sp.]|uniref:DUF3738 domain-containing protein n=1 Tax=Daejeonella sp. TaxID=2805397 RepID=UPI0030BA7400